MRVALAKSRNLVSIRLLHDIGTHHATNYISRFGFDQEQLPNNLSLALGSSEVTPLQLASGYAIFANGGFRVTPHLISSVITTEGEILYEANPEIVCEEPCQLPTPDTAEITPPNNDAGSSHVGIPTPPNYAKQVISKPVAYQMVSMMQDVIRSGTGRKAQKLGRSDLAGKTGTTNDQHDAWFSGYNRDIVATVWVGFNRHIPLGNRETGAKAALPIWIDYMQVALLDRPEYKLKPPEEMVTVRIDPKTGLLAGTDNPHAIFETFRMEYAPKRLIYDVDQTREGPHSPSTNISEQIF
jgi:penicillin-binding protein 1A